MVRTNTLVTYVRTYLLYVAMHKIIMKVASVSILIKFQKNNYHLHANLKPHSTSGYLYSSYLFVLPQDVGSDVVSQLEYSLYSYVYITLGRVAIYV